MKELDELRENISSIATWTYQRDLLELNLNLVEQAIADRYMELPVDADGAPIHVGDDLGVGTALYVSDDGVCIGGNSCGFWEATSLRHAKPTAETLLDEYAEKRMELESEYAHCTSEDAECACLGAINELIAEYAAKLREVLRDERVHLRR